MYRALPPSRQVASTASRGLVRVTRRRLATDTPPIPKKKKGVVRRIFWATTTLTGTFYVGSTFAAFYNQTYYDFFSDHVPLGQAMLEYGEAHNWDTLTLAQVADAPKKAYESAQRLVTNTVNRTPTTQDARQAVEKKAHDAQLAALNAYKESKAVLKSVATTIKKDATKAGAVVEHQSQQFSDEIADLVRKAEIALGRIPSDPSSSTAESPAAPADAAAPVDALKTAAGIYDAPLPIGFEPPPGYARPPPPPKKDVAPPPAELKPPPPPPEPLPLIAPAVVDLSTSEPVIAQLASTIDNLASYLNSNPDAAAKAKDILEEAKVEITELASRIEKVKADEQHTLEQKLDEQTKEYSLKLLELEMEAQDRLDSQSDAFRKFFDEEQVKLVQAYREKLNQELSTQTELINERLKEEVIAQGIEMQRRWIREIKVRVEQERGGRLAKIDELSANLKRLERIALDNSSYLDENIRVHALWTALRGLTNAVEAPVRKPFREELRVLRHIATAREDPVIAAALASLEASQVPDIGVEPFADLASWFATSVAPRVTTVALVPDQNAGVLSHLASHLFSAFRFQRHGLVPGSDVLSVLARAEYYMNEKDLDSAARELNQLTGTAKVLLGDWLEAARKRLEVLQALEVVQTQATLASLLVV